MPWSWLLDWVANIGDVLRNFTMFGPDGLVMHYGYMMSTQKRWTEVTIDQAVLANGEPIAPCWQRFGTELKLRRKASPYGFGIDPAIAFSTRQWAILAALGMTRSPRSLL